MDYQWKFTSGDEVSNYSEASVPYQLLLHIDNDQKKMNLILVKAVKQF